MYKYILISILVIVIILLLNSRSTKNETTIVTHIDTLYRDTTITKYKKGKDIPYEVINTVHDSVQIHDTISIVNDYLSTRVYKDTLTLDSSKFTIIDTISQNMIQGRLFLADIHEKTIVITNNIYQPNKKAFYLGPVLDLRKLDNKLGIGIAGVYKTTNNQLIGLNLTTNQISFGYYIKF
jgi:hypothetical protein